MGSSTRGSASGDAVSRDAALGRMPRAPVQTTPARRSEWARGWKRFKSYRPGVIGLGFVVVLIVLAVLPDILAPYPYTQVFRGMRGAPPSWAHLLGFDHIGRDLLSRIIWGSRVALLVGLLATGIAVVIGVAVGASAGYIGGWVDSLLSRIVDTLMAYPLLVLLITLAAVLGPSLVTVVVIIGLTTWAQYARVVRADVLSLREREFALAARAAGASSARIIFRHVVPNVASSCSNPRSRSWDSARSRRRRLGAACWRTAAPSSSSTLRSRSRRAS
jgi:peptide/nickel transport system permease protein